MKLTAAIFAVAAMALASSAPADAKGCLKGAAVGGVAGHYAGHHGALGAIAGCAYGRHRANEQDRQRQQQSRTTTHLACARDSMDCASCLDRRMQMRSSPFCRTRSHLRLASA